MVAGKLVYIALALASQAVASPALLLQSVWKWPSPGQGAEEPVHYSQLHRSDWPIDLSRYEGTMVIRVDFREHQAFRDFLLLNKHTAGVAYKVWAKLETQGYIDLEIDEESFMRLVKRFSTREAPLVYRVIIEDLPQRVFESYPAGHRSLGEHEATAEQQLAWARWSGTLEARTFEAAAATARANVSYANTRAYSELFFKEYRPIETIEAWLDILVQTFPDILRIEEIGETYEHRDYKVVHLSTQPRDGSDHERKQTIVITGGVHAREWVSVSLVCYTIYGLLQYYTEHPDQRGILEKLDFLFIPILNPDGYVYSWGLDRLWRKNRQETTFPKCFGIDIDHSYDYHWTKLTDWACGEEYSGEVPFEAIESRIWDDYLNRTNHNHAIEGYIDLHSYSQEILYPYAYLCQQQPRDEENLIELAYGISKAIRMQGGKNYEVLPACIDKDLDLQPDLGSGSSLDYMYHNKAYWAYQLKLRDSGSHGFLLPGKYIEPVGKEILAGISSQVPLVMRVVIQKVKSASVTVNEEVISSINRGLMVLVGVSTNDGIEDAKRLSGKLLRLRLFEDHANPPTDATQKWGGKPWAKSVMDDPALSILSVSQFTLYGTIKKGTKPDFHKAAKGAEARTLYDAFLQELRLEMGDDRVKDGEFGAMMDVQLVNDGPVTIVWDTNDPSI